MQPTSLPRGFTLIEQLVTLAVAAVLVAMAVPSMAHLMSHSATRTVEDALFNAARLARTQAVMHNTRALLCPSMDGQHCSHDSQWQHGWLVALDRDHDHQPDGDIVLHGRPDTHVRVLGSAGRPRIRFRADGDASGTNLTLVICPRHAGSAQPRVVIVSNSGRIREAAATSAQQARCTAV